MTIIEKKPIPYYESKCPECGSVFRYKKSEVSLAHVDCPVCGISIWASMFPIKTDGGQDDGV